MKELTFEESKEIMIKTLDSIDRCCRENNIKYSLCWGTLIGAIRHKGFIPWDDDIDVMMKRDDYNRFLKLYNDPNYDVYTPAKNKNCRQILTKISDNHTRVYYDYTEKSFYGLWVSIFPIDHTPDNNLQRWERKRTFLMNLYHAKISVFTYDESLPHRIYKLLLKTLLLPFTSFTIERWINNCLTKYNDKKTKRYCIWSGFYPRFLYYPIELFDDYVDVQFENLQCSIIKGYDSFLRSTYGDYMRLPPEEEQIPKHDYKAFFID